MKRLLPALALLALAGCDQSKRTGADEFTFEKKEWTRTDTPISFKVHPSLEDLRKAAPKGIYDRDTQILMAWSRITAAGCEVHIVDPTVRYYPQWIGHEITHCVYGRWHG